MQLDIERYRPFVDHFDMTEADKVELIQFVSSIMESFVDRAFGESSEQILQGMDVFSPIRSIANELKSNGLPPIFNDAANGEAENRRLHDR